MTTRDDRALPDPEGVVIETRAQYPTVNGAKFNPLWITTDHWTAKANKGEKLGDTIEYDAAEGDAIQDSQQQAGRKKNGITIHNAYDDGTGTTDHYGGFQHNIATEDGLFHTYTVKITGDGSVTQFVDGQKVFSKARAFPTDKELSLKASMALKDKSAVGAVGYIDYLDLSTLKA